MNMDLSYDILHDNGKKILLIGKTRFNNEIWNTLKLFRDAECISYEEFLEMENKDNYQYFTAGSNTAFQVKVVEIIKGAYPDANFVSLVSNSAQVHPECEIGRNTMIASYVLINNASKIGNNCCIQYYCNIGHTPSELGDYCFVAPYSNIVECKLAKGTWIGQYCRLLFVTTNEWSQFYMTSRVIRKNLDKSGTYKHHKLVDEQTCLTNWLDQE
tara:strand:- start:713 stop:1354 length:642 start_codon:yes stop_codon:yes gene_type:complete